METKKYIVYYNEEKNLVGYREHHFDWEEGDDIINNGIQCTIFAIFEGTKKNLHLASEMIKTINRYMPKYSWRRVLNKPMPHKTFTTENILEAVDYWFEAMKNSHEELVQTRRKTWRSFDAILDFVENVVNEEMD